MRCLPCTLEPPRGGTSFGNPEAVAVCQDCGAGLCADHLRRAAAGRPCRCPDCSGRG